MTRQVIRSVNAPAASGTYSASVRIGDLVQVSGQGPMEPATGKIVSTEFAAQARQTFSNVLELIAAAGGTEADLLMVRVYLTDEKNFAEMDQIMSGFFERPYPARTTVFVGLGTGMHIEIDAMALIAPA